MKQYITQEQLDALSENARKRYSDWILAHGWTPDIAHLIWLIDDLIRKYDGWWQIQRSDAKTDWRLVSKYIQFDEEGSPELCDALWEGVKVLLEDDEDE